MMLAADVHCESDRQFGPATFRDTCNGAWDNVYLRTVSICERELMCGSVLVKFLEYTSGNQ